jgi:hypothetical protein
MKRAREPNSAAAHANPTNTPVGILENHTKHAANDLSASEESETEEKIHVSILRKVRI